MTPTNFVFTADHGQASMGKFIFPDGSFCSAICGKNGLVIEEQKQESDGKTPIGTFKILSLYYRSDRVELPITSAIPYIPIQPNMGWCDAPEDTAYNQQVNLPFLSSHEILWRQDSLYDLLFVLDYNLGPVIAGKGSAIFLHIAPTPEQPQVTEGCIALSLEHCMKIITMLGAVNVLHIHLKEPSFSTFE